MKSDVRFPGESPEYRKARDRLLEAEVEARRAIERAAAVRRELPPGGVVPEHYVFEEAGADGGAKQVRLSELFAPGHGHADRLQLHVRPGDGAGMSVLHLDPRLP